jgi:ribosomal protein S18 acetylase RimI-like enzyme
MDSHITVRQASIHDLHNIVPVFDAYREYFQQERNPLAVQKYLFDKFEHRESVMFVAEKQSQIVGFAQLYPTFSSLTLQRVWTLNDFFIIQNYRNRGIGQQLVLAVKEYGALTKAKGIELTVQHANTKEWNFWEKRGFMMDKEFRSYFYKL